MNFVLFANARSGSTSLANVLSDSPDVNLSMESFHPKYPMWNPDERDFSSTIKSPEDMIMAIDELSIKYNAMKVLKYQFPFEIYSTMLLIPDLKVINLSRKNAFDAALSSLIAQQTGVWQKDDDAFSGELVSIEVEKIREIVEDFDENNLEYANLLDEKKPTEHIDLFYEGIFSPDNKENVELVRQIADFLKVQMPSTEIIERYMVPDRASINSKDLYEKLPNWGEIKDEFAGYL